MLTLLAACFISAISAQPLTDKTAMEKERQDLQKELKQIQDAYNAVKGQTKQNLSQLTMLNRKISLQEKYIGNISKELQLIDDDIYLSNLEIYRLQKQLDTLKEQYAKTVVYAYKNRSSYDYLNFIFSAGSFNDAVRRVAYLKSYRNYREKQVTTILETQELIAKRQQQQQGRKQQKQSVLTVQTQERNNLADQRKEKDAVVSKLKSQEKDLQRQITAKQKRDRELKNAVAAIVRREIELARKKAQEEAKEKERLRLAADKAEADREAARKAAEKNNTAVTTPKPSTPVAAPEPKKEVSSYLDLNASDVTLNSNFALNKGKLPWPVDNGVTTIGFGPYKIEGIGPNVVGENPGITIATPIGTPVKSIFEGEVVAVFNVDNMANVTIRHGKYFTIYSNLSSASVSKGAKVTRGQVVGRAGADDESEGGKLDFILMIENKNVNPKAWLHP